MSKKTNSSIYDFENYTQIQKLNCVLKIRFNNDKLPPGPKRTRNSMRSKQNGALDFTVRPGYLLCSHTKKVRELMFKKYFKILLVSKSWYLKQQGSH